MTEKGKLKITLRSDLCAASGDGFSLSIDTDVCSDRLGFPFIPSRRLKGCLREAAKYIGCVHLDEIFGVSGGSAPGSLRISDAVIAEQPSLAESVKENGFLPAQVLGLFTSVRASTAIENDTAKEGSLRFMRVVNRYSPLGGGSEEFVFFAEYEADSEYHAELVRTAKALRNIGCKRTRGFGAVSCELIAENESGEIELTVPADNDIYRIDYTVRLDSPVMLPAASSSETADYIPGGTVLGCMAAGYLKTHAADARFEELFLKDGLIFSDLCISDNGKRAEPAPAVLGKKKAETLIEYVPEYKNKNEKDTALPKPFKGGWLTERKELKPEKETVYHNGRKQGEENEKLLYTQECLSSGQYFSGSITGRGADLAEILSVFRGGTLSIGRSKTAQYSKCSIAAAECVRETPCGTVRGELYAVLVSDVLLLDDCARFTADINALAEELGVSQTEGDRKNSSIKYKTVMGYVSVGRYKRTHARAFARGSVLRFTADKPLDRYLTIGERRNEGFGRIKLCTKDELFGLGGKAPAVNIEKCAVNKRFEALVRANERREKLRASAGNFAKSFSGKLKALGSSFVGRILLMIDEAADENDLDNKDQSLPMAANPKKKNGNSGSYGRYNKGRR